MTGDGPTAAVAALSAALGADPGRGDLWSELATALVAAGRAREAWDAAARAVELAPQSAASHRAIGTVAAALGDPRQAESAYRHALLLDPADHATRTALARLPLAPTPASPTAPTGGRRRAPDPPAVPTAGRRRAADPDDAVPTSGRRRAPDVDDSAALPTGGRRRAADPGRSRHAAPAAHNEARGGRHSLGATPGGRPVPQPGPAVTAVGWPAADPGPASTAVGGWPAAAPGGWPAAEGWGGSVPVGATRVAGPWGWRRGLITVVRVEWLVGIACFVGLAYGRVAPYTAGLLAGALVVAGAYGRVRWQSAHTRRPPDPDRLPTYAAAAAVVTAVVVVPAAMAGALTVARFASVAAVTCATAAAVLMGRTAG
jgi:hypothetical protein